MVRTNETSTMVGWAAAGFLMFFVGCGAGSAPPPVWPVTDPWAALPQPAAPAPPVAEVRPAPTLTPNAPLPQEDAPSAPVAVQAPTPREAPAEAIIHQAEVRGKIGHHAGKRLTIEPLVSTSSTLPPVGSKAELYVASTQEDGEPDWLLFAEVELASAVRFGANMDVDILEENGELGAEGEAVGLLVPGSVVRLEWAW